MSFTGHNRDLEGLQGLADAAKSVLEGKTKIYELVGTLSESEMQELITLADESRELGRESFSYNGTSYSVGIAETLAKHLAEKGLDPVGKEDDDVDNDGDVDDSDEYLKKKRDAIGKAMKDEDEEEDEEDEQLDESEDTEPAGVYKDNDEVDPETDSGVEGQDDVEKTDGEDVESEEPKEVKEDIDDEDDGIEGSEDPDSEVDADTSKTSEPKGGDASADISGEEDGIEGTADEDDDTDASTSKTSEPKGGDSKVDISGEEDGIDGTEEPDDDVVESYGKPFIDIYKNMVKESYTNKKIAEAIDMKEGKMKELHGHIEDGKSAEEIIKAMKLKNTPDMKKFIQGLMK